MGGRYVCSFRATHVWDRGRLMKPEPDGLTYVLTHPDDDFGIGAVLHPAGDPRARVRAVYSWGWHDHQV